MGEGGAVLTKSSRLKKVVESFRDWGRDCYCPPGDENTCGNRFDWQLGDLPSGYDHKYIYSHCGYNLKITDMQAACGLAQLKRLSGFNEARRLNFDLLTSRVSEFEDFLILPEATEGADPSWFGYPLTLRDSDEYSRVDLLRFLDSRKIGSRLIFAGNITRQPYFSTIPHRVVGGLQNTDTVMNHSFWLGTFPGLGPDQYDFIAASLKDFFHHSKR
jgi:CDP-6-deoxy-D-xylo-4-hexulose-3-dehydrase